MAVKLDAVLEHAATLPAGQWKGLRTDIASETWVEQEFDLYFRVDVDGQTADESVNRNIFKNLEAQLHNSLRSISLSIGANGKRILDSKRAGLNKSAHLKLFPWLPWPGSVIVLQPKRLGEALANGFDLKKPLAGQRNEELGISLGQINVVRFLEPKFHVQPRTGDYLGLRRYWWRDLKVMSPMLVLPIATIELVSLEFEEGSLWPKARIRKKILAGVMALLGLGIVEGQVTPWINDYKNDARFEEQVKKAEQGPAVYYSGVDLSVDTLKKLNQSALDYNAPGISPQEKSRRIAMEQVGLNLALNYDLVVDGKLGKKTLDAEKQFGKENNVRGTNADPRFRAKLQLAFIPPSERWLPGGERR